MSRRIGVGSNIKFIAYDVRCGVATGFSVTTKGELQLTVSDLNKVCNGSTFTCTVTDNRQQILRVTGIRKYEDESVYEEGGVVHIETDIMFSTTSPNGTICWSRDFGWIYNPHKTMSPTMNVIYRASIKRDPHDQEARRQNCLFVLSKDNIQLYENPKKEDIFLNELREAERDYEQTMQPQFGEAGFNDKRDKFKQQLSTNEYNEQKLKDLANNVSVFLILDIDRGPVGKGVGRSMGVAWCMQLRKVGLKTTFIKGQSDSIEVGAWYEGVCKWNRKNTKFYGGYYVDKFWRRCDSFPFDTRPIKGGVEMDLEVNFTEPEHPLKLDDPNGNRILPHSKIQFVEVPAKIYNRHLEAKCLCVLVSRSTSDYGNAYPADWTVKEVKEVRGSAVKQTSDWCSAHASAQLPEHHSDGEEEELEGGVGGPDDDDDDLGGPDDSDDEFKAPGNFNSYSAGNSFSGPGNPPQHMGQASPNGDHSNRQSEARHTPNQWRHSSHANNGNNQKASSGSSERSSMNGDGYNSRDDTREQRRSPHGHSEQPGAEYQGIRIRPDSSQFVSTGLVTEASEHNAIIYANEFNAILVRGMDLRPGDWVELDVYDLAEPQLGGSVDYLADNDSIRPTVIASKMNVLTYKTYAMLDTPILMQYKRPSGNDGYMLHSSDVGPVHSKHELPLEEGGTVSLTDMASGTAGTEWRAWIQLRFHDVMPKSYFQWEVVKVRGPKERVEKEDRAQNSRDRGAFDDIDIEKHKAYHALRDNGPHSRVNETRDMMNDSRSSTSWNAANESTRSSNYGRPPSTTTLRHDGFSLPDDILMRMWNIPEVRRAVKVNDYELFNKIDDVILGVNKRMPLPRDQQHGGRNVNLRRDDDLYSTNGRSHAGSRMSQQSSSSTFDELRRNFHGSSAGDRSRPDSQGYYDNRRGYGNDSRSNY